MVTFSVCLLALTPSVFSAVTLITPTPHPPPLLTHGSLTLKGNVKCVGEPACTGSNGVTHQRARLCAVISRNETMYLGDRLKNGQCCSANEVV